jgi:hypothetical protein
MRTTIEVDRQRCGAPASPSQGKSVSTIITDPRCK